MIPGDKTGSFSAVLMDIEDADRTLIAVPTVALIPGSGGGRKAVLTVTNAVRAVSRVYDQVRRGGIDLGGKILRGVSEGEFDKIPALTREMKQECQQRGQEVSRKGKKEAVKQGDRAVGKGPF